MFMGKELGRVGIAVLCIGILCFCCGCETGRDSSLKVLRETSAEKWPEEVEKDCGLTGLGCPLGTVKEEYTKEESVQEIRFTIDEEMSQSLVDGYAKSVWETCVNASGARPHSSRYYIYGNVKEACRRQEPLDYYIWYYFVDSKEYRVGIYPTTMEEGLPGGLVLRIERWRKQNE